MKLSLKMLFSAVLTVLVQCSFAADVVQIRKADKVPFYSNGKRIEAVWKNADTVTGLVNPKNAIVEFSPTKAQMLYDENNLYVSMIANVLDGSRSIHFYERLGGSCIGNHMTTVDGKNYRESTYRWPDLDEFME